MKLIIIILIREIGFCIVGLFGMRFGGEGGDITFSTLRFRKLAFSCIRKFVAWRLFSSFSTSSMKLFTLISPKDAP